MIVRPLEGNQFMYKCQNIMNWGYCNQSSIWLKAHDLMLVTHRWTNKSKPYSVPIVSNTIYTCENAHNAVVRSTVSPSFFKVWPRLGYMCWVKCVMDKQVGDKNGQHKQRPIYLLFPLMTSCVSPAQRRLPPAPWPYHHNCWAGRAAVWRSPPLSACQLPPAPPAASCTNTP